MKNYQIEKEYKMMLDEKDFNLIINNLNYDKLIIQTNHYYTASNHMGMRIREIDQHYYFTLKHSINNEVREYEWEIAHNDINDPSIKELLKELKIENPNYFGSLLTKRYIKDYPKGTLCLDCNDYLNHIDYELEYELKDATIDDFKTLEEILNTYHLKFKINKISKYKRFINKMKEKEMKKVVLFIANGLEECEALNTADLLIRAGIKAELVSIEENKDIISSHNLHFSCDKMLDEIDINEFDAIILPGGLKGTISLEENKTVNEYLKQFYDEHKLIAAICAAPSIFVKNGFVKEGQFSVYPGFESGLIASNDKVSIDDNVITAKGLGASFEFASAIITYLLDEKIAKEVLDEIQY